MKVLPVNYTYYQPKVNNCKPVERHGYQQCPQSASVNPSFGKFGAAALFATILGGAAAVFAAPVAVVVGAAAVGAFGGIGMSEDDEPLNEVERYKYTHEC